MLNSPLTWRYTFDRKSSGYGGEQREHSRHARRINEVTLLTFMRV